MQEDWDRHYDQLADHGRYLLRERYRDHTDRILDEVKFLGEQFAEDPQNKAFGESVEKLFLDLGRDSSGNVSFKPHLLTDLRDVILPGIFENVRYVPIPRIEVSDPQADVVSLSFSNSLWALFITCLRSWKTLLLRVIT
jgi:hypothetical protein